MRIIIGTNEYNILIGFMYYWKAHILNLFQFRTTPIFFNFVISLDLDNWSFIIWIDFKKKAWAITKNGIKRWQ